MKKFLFFAVSIMLALAVPADAHLTIPALAAVAIAFAFSIVFPVKNRGGYANGVVTQYGLQDGFQRAKTGLSKAGLTPEEIENAVLSMSYLRLEQPVVINQSLISFPILAESGTVRATEVRLDRQDAFFCNNIAIYIFIGAGTAVVPQTYPNPITFPTGAAQLYNLYNGFLKITINKSVVVPAYPMLNFMQIPQTQLTGAANTPASQFDPAQVALWEPTINFIGTKGNLVQIQMPGGLTAVDASTFVAIELQGVLAQNVTLMS